MLFWRNLRFVIKNSRNLSIQSTLRCNLSKVTSTNALQDKNIHNFRNSAKLIIPDSRDNDTDISETSSSSAQLDANNYPTDTKVTSIAPTFNFASYINSSKPLQQLLYLGVDLSKIEKRKGLPEFLLKVDLKQIESLVLFFNDQGYEMNDLGEFITKNPLIFKEDINDLQVRINYLLSKNFKTQQIQRIIIKNPFWLMFSTERINRRLGHFQNNFKLSGNNVRYLASKQPRLITYNMEHIRKSTFSIREEMGFNDQELKHLLLNKPRLWMMNSDILNDRFYYLHNVMKLPHEKIIKFPALLTSREFRIRQRHEFLKSIGRAEYDPSNDLYVSLENLYKGSDTDFVVNTAKSDMLTYNNFLRTL